MKLLDKVKELKTKYLNTNKKQDNTIYCRICGKKINRHATFCPYVQMKKKGFFDAIKNH